ncbi:MAG: helix-turn-helix transcriptional regulator [Planctomycetes bacterium]|nr:helix-turn-helix transcriptional regulator [Planctomycetota bacterium]
MHGHAAVELVFHPTGAGVTTLEDGQSVRFADGGLVMYAPNVRHDQTMDTDGDDLCVQFTVPGVPVRALPVCLAVAGVDEPTLVRDLEVLTLGRPMADQAQRIALGYRLSALLIPLLVRATSTGPAPTATSAERHAAQARDYIRDHYQDIDSLDAVADHLGISQDYLRHLFKARYGTSMVRWLNEVRVERARDLLVHSALPHKAIAQMCGFRDEHYFSTVFRAIEGRPPGAFRRRPKDQA